MEDFHRSRREFIVSATAALLAVRPVYTQRGALTAQQIVDRLRSAIGVEWRAQSADGFKAGDPGTVVTGIAATALLLALGGVTVGCSAEQRYRR